MRNDESAFQKLNPVPISLLVFGLPTSPPCGEVVQLLKNGYATIYEDASPSRREGREVRAGRGSM
jgi:hypothetical protein